MLYEDCALHKCIAKRNQMATGICNDEHRLHPRMAFQDQAEEDAHKKVAHLATGVDNFMSQSKPNYAKVGRSRKNHQPHISRSTSFKRLDAGF